MFSRKGLRSVPSTNLTQYVEGMKRMLTKHHKILHRKESGKAITTPEIREPGAKKFFSRVVAKGELVPEIAFSRAEMRGRVELFCYVYY